MKLLNKFKFLLAALLFFSFIFLFPVLALAADLNIDCSASPTACGKSGLDPLFSSGLDGFWYPGKSITKTLNLKNSGPETREMAVKGTKTSTANILENAMYISIIGGTTAIWSGSVADFYNQDKIVMGTFAPGANPDYNFTVSMSFAADDNYQSKETVFDLTLGFWESAPGGGGTVLGESTPSAEAELNTGVVQGEQAGPLWPWLLSLIPLGWFGRFLYKRRRLR